MVIFIGKKKNINSKKRFCLKILYSIAFLSFVLFSKASSVKLKVILFMIILTCLYFNKDLGISFIYILNHKWMANMNFIPYFSLLVINNSKFNM